MASGELGPEPRASSSKGARGPCLLHTKDRLRVGLATNSRASAATCVVIGGGRPVGRSLEGPIPDRQSTLNKPSFVAPEHLHCFGMTNLAKLADLIRFPGISCALVRSVIASLPSCIHPVSARISGLRMKKGGDSTCKVLSGPAWSSKLSSPKNGASSRYIASSYSTSLSV